MPSLLRVERTIQIETSLFMNSFQFEMKHKTGKMKTEIKQ